MDYTELVLHMTHDSRGYEDTVVFKLGERNLLEGDVRIFHIGIKLEGMGVEEMQRINMQYFISPVNLELDQRNYGGMDVDIDRCVLLLDGQDYGLGHLYMEYNPVTFASSYRFVSGTSDYDLLKGRDLATFELIVDAGKTPQVNFTLIHPDSPYVESESELRALLEYKPALEMTDAELREYEKLLYREHPMTAQNTLTLSLNDENIDSGMVQMQTEKGWEWVKLQPTVDGMSAAAGLYAFAGWLTSRIDTSGPFDRWQGGKEIADLVDKFCKSQGWDIPIDMTSDWKKLLRSYPPD